MTLIVRAATMPAASLERAIRAEIKSLDPALPLADFRTMESLVVNAVARPRFSTFLLGLFATTALLLTAVGLYGSSPTRRANAHAKSESASRSAPMDETFSRWSFDRGCYPL